MLQTFIYIYIPHAHSGTQTYTKCPACTSRETAQWSAQARMRHTMLTLLLLLLVLLFATTVVVALYSVALAGVRVVCTGSVRRQYMFYTSMYAFYTCRINAVVVVVAVILFGFCICLRVPQAQEPCLCRTHGMFMCEPECSGQECKNAAIHHHHHTPKRLAIHARPTLGSSRGCFSHLRPLHDAH